MNEMNKILSNEILDVQKLNFDTEEESNRIASDIIKYHMDVITDIEPATPLFKTLEEKMKYYRKQYERKIPKKSYVLVMIDGRSFSTGIKNRLNLPFDADFIRIMNETAAYVCSKVQGSKFAFVQSDEISIFLTDINDEKVDKNENTMFFDGRLTKMLSIIPGLATSYFNRRMYEYIISKMSANGKATDIDSINQELEKWPYYHFDAKVWTVPTRNEVFGWFLHRQTDCIRNSKQQAAQTYIPHNKLRNKHTDEQIEMLYEQEGIAWGQAYSNGEKFGRFIYKESEHHEREFKGQIIPYERTVWRAHEWENPLTTPEGRKQFDDTLGILIPEAPEKEFSILGWINEKIIAFRDASSEILKSMRIIGDIDDSRACKEVPVEVAELCDFNYHDIDETKKQFDDYIDKFITADNQEPLK